MAIGQERKARLLLRVFDGKRQPINPSIKVLITIRDGFQKEVYRRYRNGPNIPFALPFFNNLADNYTVIVYAKGYKQAGFTPVRVSAAFEQSIDLMLLPEKNTLKFSHESLSELKPDDAKLYDLLSHGSTDQPAAEQRYSQLIKERPQALAALLNITTALRQINLPQLTALDYFLELMWDDSVEQDRFFAWADTKLLDQVKLAAEHGEFAPEPGANLFHKGATLSYKQVRFGEANVQLSFHEKDKRTIDQINCVKVEPDIDYYKDPAAHALLEVVPNHITGGLSNPEQVYVLRWMAGQRAGLPQFDPPYTIEPA